MRLPLPATLGKRRLEDEPDPRAGRRAEPRAPPQWPPPPQARGPQAAHRFASALVWALAACTITAYSFNSQVFVWIGSADYGGKLFELFLFHVVATVFLPCAAAPGGVGGLLAAQGTTPCRFAASAVLAALFQMEIYYLWFLASLRIPTQLLAAIFQSAIALVYVLSLCFLGERFSWRKAGGVALALAGIAVATRSRSAPPGDAAGRASPEGVVLALGAEVSKAAYQVWFKRTFGEPSPRFTLLFGASVGLAHIVPVLPVLAVLDAFGFQDARMGIAGWTPRQAGLILLGATVAGFVNIGSLAVIALRSPLFWSSMQMLAIPLSVFFDLVIRGIRPSALNVAGYALIAVAFPLLACPAPQPSRGAAAPAGGASTDPEDAGEAEREDDAAALRPRC